MINKWDIRKYPFSHIINEKSSRSLGECCFTDVSSCASHIGMVKKHFLQGSVIHSTIQTSSIVTKQKELVTVTHQTHTAHFVLAQSWRTQQLFSVPTVLCQIALCSFLHIQHIYHTALVPKIFPLTLPSTELHAWSLFLHLFSSSLSILIPQRRLGKQAK